MSTEKREETIKIDKVNREGKKISSKKEGTLWREETKKRPKLEKV